MVLALKNVCKVGKMPWKSGKWNIDNVSVDKFVSADVLCGRSIVNIALLAAIGNVVCVRFEAVQI